MDLFGLFNVGSDFLLEGLSSGVVEQWNIGMVKMENAQTQVENVKMENGVLGT